MRHGVVVAAILGSLLCGCSPVARIKLKLELEPEVQASNERWRLVATVSCKSFNSNDPPPTMPTPPSYASLSAEHTAGPMHLPHLTDVRRDGALWEVSERAGECWLALSAWYDTNGDGKLDPDDYEAKLGATHFGGPQGFFAKEPPPTLVKLRKIGATPR